MIDPETTEPVPGIEGAAGEDRPSGVFHAGEEAVQRRAGVSELAARRGPRMMQPTIDGDFAWFLAAQPFVVVAAGAAPDPLWVSPLSGPPGFAAAASPSEVRIRRGIDPADPLADALAHGPTPLGLIAIDPMSRGRIRLNGLARRTADGISVTLREVFGNCPKHIQRRRPVAAAAPSGAPPSAVRGDRLEAGQRALIEGADTFFVGSRHAARGADASHRGGRPGFVEVSPDGRRLTFPDYQGNMMFQTLGNLAVDPAIGLLFVDWDGGRTLQLTGRASIVWEGERPARWPQAERLVDVEVERVVDRPAGLPFRWELVESHRLNPEVPGRRRTPAG